MRITESRLRQVIREVLSEMSDLPQMSAKPELPKSKDEEKLMVQLVYGNAISEMFPGTIAQIVKKISDIGAYEVFVLEGPEDKKKELANMYEDDLSVDVDITLH